MHPIEALKAQHSHLEDVFHEISLARDVQTRAEILEELAKDLIAHVKLEERLLRRALFSAPREAGLWEDWEGRLRLERVIVALGAIDPSEASFSARIASLQDLFEDRIEHEETKLFPKLERFVTSRVAPLTPRPERASTYLG
jgi:hypothetical protein